VTDAGDVVFGHLLDLRFEPHGGPPALRDERRVRGGSRAVFSDLAADLADLALG
jgi:hypothetical protein